MTGRTGWRRALVYATVAVVLAAVVVAALVLFRDESGPPSGPGTHTPVAGREWYCPMHPQIVSDHPGQCPICRMDLVARDKTRARGQVNTKEAGRKVLYWYDPMVPGSKFDEPGKSPFMPEMDLVPMYAAEEPGAAGASAPPMTLSPEAIAATGVATVVVTARDLSHTIRAVGSIEADETRLERVAARVPGRIERLYAAYTGQAVRRGAPLYDLYSPDLVATQKEFLLALEQHRLLASRAGRASPESVESSRALVEAARDRLSLWGVGTAAIEQLEQTGEPHLTMTFHAPISGTVVQKSVVEGQYVEQGTDLYLLADLSSVWLVAQVYEFELGGVRPGQRVTATLSGSPARTYSGTIAFVEPVLDVSTRAVRVRIVLPNRGGEIKPGMFADAEIRIPVGHALAVPKSAVIDTGTRQVVYVEASAGSFVARPVKLGVSAGEYRQVLGGLREGERVVGAASFFLDAQAQLVTGSSVQWSGALDVQEAPDEGRRP